MSLSSLLLKMHLISNYCFPVILLHIGSLTFFAAFDLSCQQGVGLSQDENNLVWEAWSEEPIRMRSRTKNRVRDWKCREMDYRIREHESWAEKTRSWTHRKGSLIKKMGHGWRERESVLWIERTGSRTERTGSLTERSRQKKKTESESMRMHQSKQGHAGVDRAMDQGNINTD